MNYFEFGPLVHQEKMSFKVVSHLELWCPFRSVEKNHLCNFGKGIMRNNSVK